MFEQNAGTEAIRLVKNVRSASLQAEPSSRGTDLKRQWLAFMPEAEADAAVARKLNHKILRNEQAIRGLTPEITDLMLRTGQDNDVTLSPEFFLQRNALRCAPVVVVIREGEELAAVLYGRERRVAGFRTGMVQFGDYYGDGAVIARPDFRARAVAWGALNALDLPLVHSVRTSFKIKDQEETLAIERMMERSPLKTRMLPEMVRHILPLKGTFEAFLGTLGSHTRRNLRVYRRRVEQKGWKFVPRLTPEQIDDAFASLEQQQGRHASTPHYLNCCRLALKEVPGSFYSGICTDTGDWASLAAGWLRPDCYFMLVQLNDARHVKESISTVMRSYLIEDVIAAGVNSINFVGGSSELLRNFCTSELCAHYLFERRGLLSSVREALAPRYFKTSMVSRIIRGDADISSLMESESDSE